MTSSQSNILVENVEEELIVPHWFYDSVNDTYFQIINGVKTEYNLNDPTTCYGTYLAMGNTAQCRIVINCIADGDPNSLNRCLTIIQDFDIWDVPGTDIANIHPDTIRLVLKKFNVKGKMENDSYNDSYKVPMTEAMIWMVPEESASNPNDLDLYL